MRPKMTRLPRLAYPLCALGLLLLTGLALGFPTLYFSFSDQVSFSRVRVENISSGQIYLPANTEQTVQMIVEGSYTASNTDLSYSEMETRVRRCLETFAARYAANKSPNTPRAGTMFINICIFFFLPLTCFAC